MCNSPTQFFIDATGFVRVLKVLEVQQLNRIEDKSVFSQFSHLTECYEKYA